MTDTIGLNETKSEVPGAPLLRARSLSRHYERGPQTIRAVDNVDLSVDRGELLGVVGASGSGKSTLLNLMAGLDTPTSGAIEFKGVALGSLARRDRSAYRAHKVGMVFQSFNLIPHLDARENVEMALLLGGTPRRERRPRAEEILARLGLADRLTHLPGDLSGGEQQRVAIARALVKRPEVLVADEPTGNLDEETTEQISSLLLEFHRQGLTILLVTHDVDLARRCAQRVVRMQYGRLVETSPGSPGATE